MTEPSVPLEVHIVKSSVDLTRRQVRDRTATFTSVTITDSSDPVCILGHAPTRKNAVVIVTGGAADTVILSGDRSDAQNGQGATLPTGLAPLHLTTTGSVWAGSVSPGGTVTISVVAEYGER